MDQVHDNMAPWISAYPIISVLVAFALGLASMVELIRLAQRVSDGKLAPAKEPQSERPNYGAWRPRTAGDAMTPTV